MQRRRPPHEAIHNHAFEFRTIDGQIPFDLMLKELDPKKVGMEMDIYWGSQCRARSAEVF